MKAISSSTYISKSYLSPKNGINDPNKFIPSTNIASQVTSNSSMNWKPKTNIQTMISPKDIRDKGLLFKSPKYIALNKNETGFKGSAVYSKT
jgi:hypothetical protein